MVRIDNQQCRLYAAAVNSETAAWLLVFAVWYKPPTKHDSQYADNSFLQTLPYDGEAHRPPDPSTFILFRYIKPGTDVMRREAILVLCVALLVALAGCGGVDRDGSGLNKTVEERSEPGDRRADAGGDEQTDLEAQDEDRASMAQKDVRVVSGLEEAGLANAPLSNETLKAIEFLADLPQNRTKRNRTVIAAATAICKSHDQAVPEDASNVSNVGKEVYEQTYGVEHAAKVMQDRLGADINVRTVERQMESVRRYSSVAEQYAPVLGSYNRLHKASCAVEQGEPGAKQDFYIASAEFAVDLALAKEGVIYRASFKTTGMASRAVGMNRLARVCGWKCVGLVQSEIHWLVRGTYSGALDTVSKTAIQGNVTVGGWNESVRQDVGKFVGNQTDATLVGGHLVPETKVVDCVKEHIDSKDIPDIAFDIGRDAAGVLREVQEEQRLPEGADLTFLTEIDGIEACLNE